VDIVINGYPKDQWDECRHKKGDLWLKDGVVPNCKVMDKIVDDK
jgi:hypothetical protein